MAHRVKVTSKRCTRIVFSHYTRLNNRSFYNCLPCHSANDKPLEVPSDTTLDTLPPSVLAKSRKIELRPGPKKDSLITCSSAIPSSRGSERSSLSKEKPQSCATISAPTPATLSHNGPAPAIRKDVKNAEKQGIFTPPPEGASRIGGLFHQAKQLVKFYLEGLKAQYRNNRQMRAILSRVAQDKAAGKPGPLMTRWETQFVRTHKKDLRKLVPFVLTLVILEEALPFIVLYAPGMLPSTTILPSQADRIYDRKEEKKAEALVQAKIFLESTNKSTPSDTSKLGITKLDDDLAWMICRAYGLSDRGPRSFVNGRLYKHIAYISSDDRLLIHEGYGERLSFHELRAALSERGYLTARRSETELRQTLRRWLTKVDNPEDMIESLLAHALDADVEAAIRN